MRLAMLGFLGVAITAVSIADGAEVSELILKLKDRDSDIRRTAAKDLSELGAEAREAVPALTKAVRDSDLFVRRFSAEALGNIGPEAKSAITVLAGAMKDERKEVQLAAVTALGKIGPESIPALISAVKDPNKEPTIRKMAAQALGKNGLRARAAVPALTDVVTGRIASPKVPRKKDKNLNDDDVKVDAALALGRVAKSEDAAAIAALKSVSEGKQRNRALQKAARESLRKITGEAPARKK